MTDQEKIAWFLIFKANRFHFVENGHIYCDLFLKEKDLKNILGWRDKAASIVWSKIAGYIFTGVSGLDSDTCPFCLRPGRNMIAFCGRCPYAKVHGVCSDDNSMFKNVAMWMNTLPPEVRKELFSNEVYKEIINVIENG